MINNKAGYGVQCPMCKEKIYSLWRHDCHHCNCGYTMVDGGFDYLRFGWGGEGWPQPWIVPKTVRKPRVKKLAVPKGASKPGARQPLGKPNGKRLRKKSKSAAS